MESLKFDSTIACASWRRKSAMAAYFAHSSYNAVHHVRRISLDTRLGPVHSIVLLRVRALLLVFAVFVGDVLVATALLLLTPPFHSVTKLVFIAVLLITEAATGPSGHKRAHTIGVQLDLSPRIKHTITNRYRRKIRARMLVTKRSAGLKWMTGGSQAAT